jgi:hypothetical protein
VANISGRYRLPYMYRGRPSATPSQASKLSALAWWHALFRRVQGTARCLFTKGGVVLD